MTMPPRLRKLGLTVHVTASVGWHGAIAAYLMMEPVAWFAIVPLALLSLR